jgi:hypothetical protein
MERQKLIKYLLVAQFIIFIIVLALWAQYYCVNHPNEGPC